MRALSETDRELNLCLYWTKETISDREELHFQVILGGMLRDAEVKELKGITLTSNTTFFFAVTTT